MGGVASELAANGIPISVKAGDPGDFGDVAPWAADGVPGFIYVNEDMYQYYFYFHHTKADTMTVYKAEDIDYTAAVFAVFANAIANF